MRYRIERFRSVGQYLYADVAFLEDARPVVVHRNDFVMDIRATITQYIGPPLGEGESPDPADYETASRVESAILDEIVANIERYMTRHEGRQSPPFDNRDSRIVVSDTDPRGIRALASVAALEGRIRTRR